jgi:heterodisulfide reductase subunit C
VAPEGVMKATAHWLELKGHTAKSPSTHFDEEFTEQVVRRGRIEDTEVLRGFFKRTQQPLMQDWLVAIGLGIAKRLPVVWGIKMLLAQVFKPRTRGWGKARAAIAEYIHEQEASHRQALSLAPAGKEVRAANEKPQVGKLAAAE